MDSAEIGVLEESDKVSLTSLLKGKDSRSLESDVTLGLRSNLSNESLEWEFSNEELGRFLISSDLSSSNGSWSESVGFLDSSSLGDRLLGGSLGSGFSTNFLRANI